MECEDKSMEKQKLVEEVNDEEDITLPSIVTTTQSKTPISPPNVYSTGSESQSLGKGSDVKISIVNERKSSEAENARKESLERKKKMLKEPEFELSPSSSSDSSKNLIDLKRCFESSVTSVNIEKHEKVHSTPTQKSNFNLPLPSTSSHPMLIKLPSKNPITSSLQSFDTRPIKHHSFDSDLDVKYMEKNLISLLDDFHNGKLKAFSGSSMNQMKNIRDQQEKISKLHFDLNMMGTTSSNDAKNDQMAQLVQKLNEISHSIEKLNSNADP